MALNVQWRWGMPQVGSPNGPAEAQARGIQALGEGIGNLIRNIGEQERRDLAQRNWERQFAEQQQNARNQQQNWERQFEQSKALQDFNIGRQRTQDEWLQKFYDAYFGDDAEWQELQKLRAKYGKGGDTVSDSSLIMMGLNPALR